jgi:hypothetical protein
MAPALALTNDHWKRSEFGEVRGTLENGIALRAIGVAAKRAILELY